jgi:hypothetical protein
MAQKVTPERQRLYSLIDDLPEQELTAAARYLEFLASQSDEQDNEAKYHEFLRRRVKECDEARARGEVYTTEQVTDMVNQWISESSG